MSNNSLPALGIVGAGAIGCAIAGAVADGTLPYRFAGFADTDASRGERLCTLLGFAPPLLSVAELAAACDVLVECAAAAAVAPTVDAARTAYGAGGRPRHLLVLSIGGLLDVDLGAPGPVIHAPSGAIGGLDAVQALAIAGLDEVTLTTRKPPAGLGMDVDVETLLFEGSARDVIARYPKNVNVAVALSFAGIGPDRTRCRLIADPAVDRNTHQVYARGAAGEVEFTSRNVAFPENPATSYLAALSAIALLKRLQAQFQVG
jgi:aspartate dehydrogenase